MHILLSATVTSRFCKPKTGKAWNYVRQMQSGCRGREDISQLALLLMGEALRSGCRRKGIRN